MFFIVSLKVLLTHRYYWPDKTPCAGSMHWIAKHLASRGHEVDVISSQPSYRKSSLSVRCPKLEMINGVNVRRLSLVHETGMPLWRILNALHLGVWILLKAFLRKYDVIIVSTIPPVLGGFFSALSAKLIRARLIYFCMDLHPEVGRVSGDFANPWLFTLLMRIDDWSCRRASPVLVHSEDMRRTLRTRPRGREYNIQIMNNFALPSDAVCEAAIDFSFGFNVLKVIYAGNFGRFQGLETVIDAMTMIAHRKDIILVLMGDGVAKAELIKRAQAGKANVQFVDYQPVSVAKSTIQQADIGLVTLIPEMYKYAYPGKTMAYLEQGRPILAAVESESELSQDMRSQGYGFSVPVGDSNALAELLIQLADDDSWKKQMNAAALSAFKRNFSAQVVLNRWSRVVETGSCA